MKQILYGGVAVAASFGLLGVVTVPSVAAGAQQEALPDTLTLEGAIRTALGRHPNMRGAEARVDAAAASYRAGWGAFLPQARVAASLAHTNFTTVSFENPEGSSNQLPTPLESARKNSSQGLSLTWDLLRGGQRFADLSERGATSAAANRRLSNVERVLARQVKVAYFEALKQGRLVEVAGRQLDGRRRDLEVARRRYEIAAVNRTDVLGAEIEVANAELSLVDAINFELSANRDLRVQMGLEGEAERYPALRDVETVPDAEMLEAEPLVDAAVSSKPEITALEADVEAASAGLWGARATYLPTISVGYAYGRSETSGPSGDFFNFDPSDSSQQLTLSASWTIFDGFNRENQTAQRRSALRERESELALRRLTLEQAVRDLVTEIRTRAQRLEIRERNFRLAEQRLDMLRERYRLGTVEYVDLLSSITQLTNAEQALIQERYEYLKTWANLEEQVGDRF